MLLNDTSGTRTQSILRLESDPVHEDESISSAIKPGEKG
jgi:hypothetical protein